MSTNSRIMISTPTAIYTRRQKVVRERKQPASAHTCKCRRELFSDQECVVVCGYYYAVIVTDFLMRAKKEKILKFTFYPRSPCVNMRSAACQCVGHAECKWTITVKHEEEKIFTTQRKNHRQSSLGLLLACVVLISSQSHAQSSSTRFVRFGRRKNNIGSIMSPETVCALCVPFRNILRNACNFYESLKTIIWRYGQV